MAFKSSGSPVATADLGAQLGTFTQARTVREHFRALRKRLEYEQQAGKVVSAD